ncbi:uncharacterized protein LOC116113586 [Pistacia vera]|uniref:uncharacterized protein LOC116113586 n=1 Tax=Pistacia vera TaxID=55513 RepID=UPI001263C246|nr:uncharacterized protein LOC116113586 [Pistacia vera]XP_031255595.1 uncharacterized protein LOC116113586 [Pistacia vera]
MGRFLISSSLKKMRRDHILKNPICVVFITISICCLFVLIFSMLRLPEISLGRPYSNMINRDVLRDDELGKFVEMMVGMLPEDLAFTVFVPSEKAFERDLRLRVNHDLEGDKINNTYAILSRILGFSAVPRTLTTLTVPFGEEISYDSLSGFTLYISKVSDAMLVVNRVKSERVDLKKGKIVVHIMDGVIMDADFEQSVLPDNNEEDE